MLTSSISFVRRKESNGSLPFELYTCLMEVGNLVNQRPIGHIPNDPYLCLNDMLLG